MYIREMNVKHMLYSTKWFIGNLSVRVTVPKVLRLEDILHWLTRNGKRMVGLG